MVRRLSQMRDTISLVFICNKQTIIRVMRGQCEQESAHIM